MSALDSPFRDINGESGRLFRKRMKEYHLKKAAEQVIKDGSIENIGNEGVDVVVDPKALEQKRLRHDPRTGIREIVHTGNKEFVQGDTILRPRGGGAGGGGDGAGGESGEDTFRFTAQEILEYIFDQLELPADERVVLQNPKKTKPKRAGFSNSGIPPRRDPARTEQKRRGRCMVTAAPHYKGILEKLGEIFNILSAVGQREAPQQLPEPEPEKPTRHGQDTFVPLRLQVEHKSRNVEKLSDIFLGLANRTEKDRVAALNRKINEERERIGIIPWFIDRDSHYRNFTNKPVPENKAVMFAIMDVSGSMDEEKKIKAKLTFFLLKRFLDTKYDHVEIVYIRHHTTAEAVDEERFFNDRTNGGTLVSSGLKLMDEMAGKFREDGFNIHVLQASDGDNEVKDNPAVKPLMEKILGYVKTFSYAEITSDEPQNLWRLYENLQKKHQNNMSMGNIKERTDIVPIFRKFFPKRSSNAAAAPAYA